MNHTNKQNDKKNFIDYYYLKKLEEMSGMSGGAVAGIIIGVLAGVGAVAGAVYYFYWMPMQAAKMGGGAASVSRKLGDNHLPMMAMRVNGDDDL